MFWGQALIEFRRTNKARSWPNFRAWHLKTDSKSAFATSLVGSRSPPLTTSFGISAFDMSRGTHPPTLPMSSRMHHFPNRRPAQPTPRRNPEEIRQGQLHAYDNRENVLKTIGSGRLTARPPSPEILEQIVEHSMSGSHEASMAYPMESLLENISAEVVNINAPTVLLAGELDQVDSIERHKA